MNVKKAKDVSVGVALKFFPILVGMKFPTEETSDNAAILLLSEVWGSGICVFKPK